MRLTAIFPILALGIALVLAFLCTFAGTNKDMLEYYDILTLNTSRIAVDIFNTTTEDNEPKHMDSDNPFTNFLNDVGDEIHNATDSAKAEIEEALNNVVQSFAKSLGLRDFYSLHVLNHCQGYFHPNGTSSRNVTYCTNTTSFSHFNARQTLQTQLNHSGIDVNLTDLHWPDKIDEALGDLKLAFNIMFILYCIGIIGVGLAFFGSILGLFFHGRKSSLGNIFLTQCAFFALLIASAIITVGATKATDAINKFGKPIDVNAARGDRLIAMTWAADILVFLASVAWLVEFMIGRRKEKMIPKQFQ